LYNVFSYFLFLTQNTYTFINNNTNTNNMRKERMGVKMDCRKGKVLEKVSPCEAIALSEAIDRQAVPKELGLSITLNE